ncbi:hypothetical protein NicSoilC12_20690 [Arthrobacter sp. NicSoilC12]|nr:hypothetical protein NicSoilC12_20690 [Arthrobacter sp. NicSoilC12]
MERNPSHFGSKSQPVPASGDGRAGSALASMGAMGGINGRCIAPILAPRTRDRHPHAVVPREGLLNWGLLDTARPRR